MRDDLDAFLDRAWNLHRTVAYGIHRAVLTGGNVRWRTSPDRCHQMMAADQREYGQRITFTTESNELRLFGLPVEPIVTDDPLHPPSSRDPLELCFWERDA